jgi:hypothetical protein
MKKLILIIFLLFSLNYAFAQDTRPKLYFLADTINVAKNHRVLHIETVSSFEYSFIFYCKCAAPYKSYVSFFYLNDKKKPRSTVVSQKPDYPYISFKELMDLVNKHHRFFNENYDLFITELLPDRKYKTTKVNFIPYQEPIQDFILLDRKQ